MKVCINLVHIIIISHSFFVYFREFEDLERSHAYLTDLVERQGIPVFSDISIALDCTQKAIKEVITATT